MSATVYFYVRTEVVGGYTYEMAQVRSPRPALELDEVPAVGDLLYLNNVGTVRVVTRSWTHTVYGSPNWPRGQRRQRADLLDLIVELADGPFDSDVGDVDFEENQ